MKGYLDCWMPGGYGFAYCYDTKGTKGTRYFVHVTCITNLKDGEKPHTGNFIEFDPGMSRKGPVALNVRMLGRAETIAEMLTMGGMGGKS